VLLSRHKLTIRPGPQFPKVWYKDEGGRDKFISVDAVLTDQHNNIVTDREVPLRVVLTYEGDPDAEVKNQSILKLSNDTIPKVSRDGRVFLKVRIEEVSKNHQKQAFCVKIQPDTSYSPANNDIAMHVSPPITVKSKRNKRNRTRELKSAGEKKARPEPTLAASSVLGMSGPAAAAPFAADQIDSLRNNGDSALVLGMVRSWCSFVVDGMRTMEWQHVGFEVVEGGQINLHRPLYRCPGCWAYKDTLREPVHRPDCTLARALQGYRKCNIDEQLSRMVSAIKQDGKSNQSKPHVNISSTSTGVPSTITNSMKGTAPFLPPSPVLQSGVSIPSGLQPPQPTPSKQFVSCTTVP